MDVDLNGTTIHLDRPSDKAVVQRVAAQIQRRIAEDDWRPYSSKADALGAWKNATRKDIIHTLLLTEATADVALSLLMK